MQATSTHGLDVTVLMTAYNGEEYIRQSIDTVLAQSFTNFELLIIDDGSTDGTAQIVAEYSHIDPRIRVLTQANGGIAQAANLGIAAANGRYLAILDQDDLATPLWLAAAVEEMDAHPNLVALGGNYSLIDGHSRFLTTIQQLKGNEALQAAALKGICPLSHPGSVMRIESVIAVGAYRPEFEPAHDLDLYLRLGEIGELDNLDLTTVRYRLHARATSEKKAAIQRQKAKDACAAAWARRGISGNFEANTSWRPDGTPDSDHVFALQYGWWAFNSAERRTALSYGIRAISLKPFNRKGWQLALAAIRKQPSPSEH